MVNSREVMTIVLLSIGFLFIVGYNTIQSELDKVATQNKSNLRNTSTKISEFSYLDKIVNDFDNSLLDARPPIPVIYANFADTGDPFPDPDSAEEDVISKTPLSLGFHKEVEGKKLEKASKTKQSPDIALFWHLPRSGGSTITSLLGECLGLTLASSGNQQNIPYLDQDVLRIVRYQNSKYVNVDLSTTDGIERAAKLNLIYETVSPSSTDPLVDVVVSPNLYSISKHVFNPAKETKVSRRKGRLFTIFRHPVEREVSWFYHIKNNQNMYNDKINVKIYELSDWLLSDLFIDNIMVRSIINKMNRADEVTVYDLYVAKEVIRRKCLILLMEEKSSSLERLVDYFHWNHHQDGAGIAGQECEERTLHWGWQNKNRHPIIEHSSFVVDGEENNNNSFLDRQSYERVRLVNLFDIQLYEYARYLFWQQGKSFR